MSMILVIPKEIEGLKEVEAALNHEMIEQIFSTKPGKPEMTLYVPKFKLESSFSLKNPLSAVSIFQTMFKKKTRKFQVLKSFSFGEVGNVDGVRRKLG